jgi:hypothetical protein
MVAIFACETLPLHFARKLLVGSRGMLKPTTI